MIPLAIRLNRTQLGSAWTSANLPDSYPLAIAAGTVWTFSFPTMGRADYFYLIPFATRIAYAQFQHPLTSAWTRPIKVTTALSGGAPIPATLNYPVGLQVPGMAHQEVASGVTLALTVAENSIFDVAKYATTFYG